MQTDTMTLYKLIILYILDHVDFPLTNAQVSGFILEKEYTNYFNIQQAISDLKEAELIFCETIRNSSYYRITKDGKETLYFFEDKISDAIKQDIDTFLKENKYSLRAEVSTLADFYRRQRGEYTARCRVIEQGSPIIELNLTVPTQTSAEAICNNWKKHSQEVYAYLMNLLNQDSSSGKTLPPTEKEKGS